MTTRIIQITGGEKFQLSPRALDGAITEQLRHYGPLIATTILALDEDTKRENRT